MSVGSRPHQVPEKPLRFGNSRFREGWGTKALGVNMRAGKSDWPPLAPVGLAVGQVS